MKIVTTNIYICIVLVVLTLTYTNADDTNLNQGGVPYNIANPEGSTKNWQGTPGIYTTEFKNNQHGDVEYFDVYGEVRTHYSQVYWTRNLPINLPPKLVERFKNKVMAITG